MRWSLVAIVVGINLVNAIARTEFATEPPADLFTADIAEAQRDASVATFVQPLGRDVNNPVGFGAPGAGYLGEYPIPPAYYSLLATGQTRDRTIATPRLLNLRNGLARRHRFQRLYGGHLIRAASDEARIAQSLSGLLRQPSNQPWRRIILWTTGEPEEEQIESALQAIDPTWQRGEDAIYPVREHWTWQAFTPMRRREYRR